MQIVAILSRPQRVKKLHFLTYVIIRIIQPAAYTETTCVSDLSIDLVA